jgi:hypothetical protein
MERLSVSTQLPVKLVCLLAMALLVPLAQASILGNGGSVPPSPLFPTGTQVAFTSGTMTSPKTNDSYTQWVYSDPTNTWCAGCLDFVYQFTNNGGDPNARFTMSNFAGFSADVGTNPFGGLTHEPLRIDRSSLGPVISFNYVGSEIVPGETTPYLVIETNARYFTTGFVSVQDGTTVYGVAYAPAVPEPSSLALMGGGLTVVGALMRKFRIGKSV